MPLLRPQRAQKDSGGSSSGRSNSYNSAGLVVLCAAAAAALDPRRYASSPGSSSSSRAALHPHLLPSQAGEGGGAGVEACCCPPRRQLLQLQLLLLLEEDVVGAGEAATAWPCQEEEEEATATVDATSPLPLQCPCHHYAAPTVAPLTAALDPHRHPRSCRRRCRCATLTRRLRGLQGGSRSGAGSLMIIVSSGRPRASIPCLLGEEGEGLAAASRTSSNSSSPELWSGVVGMLGSAAPRQLWLLLPPPLQLSARLRACRSSGKEVPCPHTSEPQQRTASSGRSRSTNSNPKPWSLHHTRGSSSISGSNSNSMLRRRQQGRTGTPTTQRTSS
jgi:hypothetical protein